MLKGKTALVVGGTAGIGHGIALNLAGKGCNVTIMGRNETRGNAIVQEMKKLAPAPEEQTFGFAKTDATLLQSAHDTSLAWAKTQSKLDFLALTAGMGTVAGREETKEGLSDKLSIHYYGRLAYIDALLPLLKASGDGRVLSVLSGGVHSAYTDYETDPELKTGFSLMNCANAAGFYNDIAMDSLARENKEVSFTHAAPGFVNTNWGTEMPWYIRGPVRALQVFGKSKETCAGFMSLPFSEDKFKGGFHLLTEDGKDAKITPLHEAAREAVWTQTKSVLQRILGPSALAATSSAPEPTESGRES